LKLKKEIKLAMKLTDLVREREKDRADRQTGKQATNTDRLIDRQA
jgi:hypothetical protein